MELDLVENLKQSIQISLDIHVYAQSIIYEGKLFQDSLQIKDYCILRNTTITLNLRLWGAGGVGGVLGSINSSGFISFRDVVKGKAPKLV